MDENQGEEEGQKLTVQGIRIRIKHVRKEHEARQMNWTIRQQNKDKNGTDWRQWDKSGCVWEE